MNSCLVRFEDGYMMVTSRNALGIKVPFNPTVAAETVSLRREPFLFLFAGREVRLPSRRRALLARGSGDRLDLFFFRLLLLPIASLFASGHGDLPLVDEQAITAPPTSLP
jgi:hypothetical protein